MIESKTLFKNDWANLFEDYIKTDEFQNHMNWLKTEYNNGICYPPSPKIFKAFNVCPPNHLRVVWLGLDPYINEGEATGIAMASLGPKYPPTLRNLEKEFNSDLGKDGMDLTFEKYYDRVLFLNTALTVRRGETKSHWKEWQPFTEHVLKVLNDRFIELAFVLLGNEAKTYSSLITNKTHTIISAPHPVSETYKPGSGFFGSKIFTKINEHVENYYGEERIF